MSKTLWPLGLFQAFGLELEYMIVRADTLNVLPIADEVLRKAAGELVSEVDLGEVSWSNELALHVLELKTSAPAPSLEGLSHAFQDNVRRANQILAEFNACLLPTAMHPWMDPDTEMKLWPHEYNPVYEAYHRIFDCRGHGWANLQSAHLNLPFANEAEFGRLHAAIRLLLPILPALAASSPILQRQWTGAMDNRLDAYRKNSRRVPSITGSVVPEAAFTLEQYDREILQRMYDDMAELDVNGVLRHEWLNSRGAIARFDRGAIEIRVLDVQECPAADVAIVRLIAGVLQVLVAETWSDLPTQQSMETERLASIYRDCVHNADQSLINDSQYLAQLGAGPGQCTAADLWKRLEQATRQADARRQAARPAPASGRQSEEEALRVILSVGPLSRRIQRALQSDMTQLEDVYRQLAQCLEEGKSFG